MANCHRSIAHAQILLAVKLFKLLEPLLNLDRFAQALVEALEELSTLLFRNRLNESAKAVDFDMSLLELFLHFRDMHHLVRLRILVPNLELCLVFYKLKMSCLSLRLSFDQFSHLVDHFLILGEELGSVINFLL